MVAEYWTVLPPIHLLEQKLREALIEARQRLEHKKLTGEKLNEIGFTVNNR